MSATPVWLWAACWVAACIAFGWAWARTKERYTDHEHANPHCDCEACQL